jgi:cell division septation protein DedD
MSRRGGIVREDEREDGPMPWLEPAEVDAVELPRRSLGIWMLLLGALLILVVGLVYAQIAKPRDETPVYAENGEVPLIRAPDSPFKVRPVDPGGLDLEGVSQTAHAAAGGLDPGGELNFDALPEEPIDRSVLLAGAPSAPPAPEASQTDREPTPAPAEPVKSTAEKPETKSEPADEKKEPVADEGGSFALQLGAFSSQAKANEAWKRFTGRYSYLTDLEKSVIELERDGEKLYRLRATGVTSRAQADNLCARLKVAGDQCTVVD